ncbi:MAG: hypothetical protein M0P94_03315 [Candidatus Absconditabacterales bacterium]|nr:hypothetical protein [Candidatus Absconditabacterales bacterium]
MNEIDLEIIDIQNLQDILKNIYLTPFFDKNIVKLIDSINADIENTLTVETDIYYLRNYRDNLFLTISFLRGSINKLIPYEVIFVIEKILESDFKTNLKILTKMLGEFNYCIYNDFDIKSLFDINNISEKYIIMGLPENYKDIPLNNIALFHEAGHFIERNYAISNAILLFYTDEVFNILSKLLNIDIFDYFKTNDRKKIAENYLKEFFSDLYGAQFSGKGFIELLKKLKFSDQGNVSYTHPDIDLRINVVEDFLFGKNNDIINIINEGIKITRYNRQLVYHKIEFEKYFIYFENFVPIQIENDFELKKIFEIGWEFLLSDRINEGDFGRLSQKKKFDIINNLVQKSIRDYMIKKQWNSIDEVTD